MYSRYKTIFLYYTGGMLKVFLPVLVIIIGIGFIAYDQGTENAPSQKTEDVHSDVRVPEAQVADTERLVSGKSILDLSNRELTRTPEYVFDEVDIERLDLSHNNLTGSLQGEIRHLQNLKILDLSNNEFTGVPAEIGQLKNLEVLNLSNNRITGLPLELGNLSNLKVLNLKGNNYAETDLELIRNRLPASTIIEVD